MKFALCACLLMPMLSFAQTGIDLKKEEAAIRNLIAHPDQIKTTNDAILWSGAEPRPSVGSQRTPPFTEAQVEKRRNVKRSVAEIKRIDIASSGDLAYEYATGTLDFDLDVTPPRHRTIQRAWLSVWKKVNGEWRIAAQFSRPLDEPFVIPRAQ